MIAFFCFSRIVNYDMRDAFLVTLHSLFWEGFVLLNSNEKLIFPFVYVLFLLQALVCSHVSVHAESFFEETCSWQQEHYNNKKS